MRRASIVGATLMATLAFAPLASGQERPDATEREPPTADADSPETSDADLANQLANPIANLLSIPLPNNFDFGLGEGDDGFRYQLNIQPVIPIPLGRHWRLVVRVVFPILIYQENVVTPQDPVGESFAGAGDATASLFLVPPHEVAGLTIGAGPAVVPPTSTDHRLAPGHTGIGPTAVAIWQSHGVTIGLLANHVWAITDEDDDYSQTFLQPQLAYVLPTNTTLTIQSETLYQWYSGVWTVPIIGGVGQLVRVGPVPLSIGLHGKWWVEHPEAAPDWGLRAFVTALLPVGGD